MTIVLKKTITYAAKKAFSLPWIKDDQYKQYLFWNTGNNEKLIAYSTEKLLLINNSSILLRPPGKKPL